jgi:hypothetical protein
VTDFSNRLKRMAPQVGLEPTTLRLTAGCSAIELLRSVVAPLKKQGAGSEHRHHIKAFRYLEIAHDVTLDFSLTGFIHLGMQFLQRAWDGKRRVYFRGFDLLFPACYKGPFCVGGCSRAGCVPCRAAPRELKSDAAKLSTPFHVLQWKRVRNSGNALTRPPFATASGAFATPERGIETRS